MRKAGYVLSIALGLCLGGAFIGCGSSGITTGNTQPQSQTITFNQPATPSPYGSSESLSATGGGSGNAVTFSIDGSSTGKGTISGNTVMLTGVGTLVIDANQAGNGSYSAAPQVQRTITVTEVAPTVSVWPTASAITAGQALSSSTLTGGTASVPGTFAWTNPSAVPATGTDSEGVTFTPTDATDYMVVNGTVSVVVNSTKSTTATITNATPRYAVADDFTFNFPYTFTATGLENGATAHDASGFFPDVTLSLAPGATSFGLTLQWQQGYFQPQFDSWEVQNPGEAYGNQWATAFLGSASQSTAVASSTTGTVFQDDEETGCVYTVTANGTKGTPCSGGTAASSPSAIAIDDVTSDIIGMATGVTYSSTDKIAPGIGVSDVNGKPLCYLTITGISYISSVAAKGEYGAFTAPNEGLVGYFSLAGCTGNVAIGYKTVSVTGQPWSVAMVNGAEIDAFILSRDKASSNGLPELSKLNVSTGTIDGSVELTGLPPVTTVRATTATAYEGVYQVAAFKQTPVAEVLFMSDPTDGVILTINTSTMKVANSTPVTDLPFGITPQETASSSTLWVAYISASNGEAVTHIGALDPATGNYTPAIGACQTGILAGGFVATAQGVYCAQGSVIAPPLVLQP